MAHSTQTADGGALLRGAGLGLFALVGAFYVLFGAFYFSVNDILFFHAAAVPEAAREAVRPLYFALMRLIGGASVALGLLGLYGVAWPLRRGVPFAALALALAFALPALAAAYVAETLAKAAGAPTSWHLMGILLGFVAAALAASLLGARRH
ncbi:MAG: hypothetical protein GC189_05975 [Alphaproteobacteria bacterium]|nr:hypothetical protein [Alphaproteobacteria bacterium]